MRVLKDSFFFSLFFRIIRYTRSSFFSPSGKVIKLRPGVTQPTPPHPPPLHYGSCLLVVLQGGYFNPVLSRRLVSDRAYPRYALSAVDCFACFAKLQ